MRDGETTAVLAALGLLIALSVLARACAARADESPREVLARVVEIESTSRLDWAAIVHVLERRWRLTRRAQGWSLAEQARRYSPPVRAWYTPEPWHWSPRQTRVLRMPSRAAYELVDRYLRGALRDPCPRALHWRARRAHERHAAGACSSATSNLFL